MVYFRREFIACPRILRTRHKKTGGKVPPVLLKWQSAWTCQGLEIKLKSGGQYQAIKATQDIFYLSEGHEILAYIKIGARTKVQADFTST